MKLLERGPSIFFFLPSSRLLDWGSYVYAHFPRSPVSILPNIQVTNEDTPQIYIFLHLIAHTPRLPFPSEKTYLTTNPDGTVSAPRPLPCWYDRWRAEGRRNQEYPTIPAGFPVPDQAIIEPAEVEVSVVIPAYNEEARISAALEEMVEYLDQQFGRPDASSGPSPPAQQKKGRKGKGTTPHRLVFKPDSPGSGNTPHPSKSQGQDGAGPSGYEILVVNDGSQDRTVEVALEFSRKHGLHDILRVITLEKNRGKGGAVTHGLRHVRGKYAVFADADGASRFSDLGRLIEGCEDVVDGSNRGVAIGSRAHLVASEAVVKVCSLCKSPKKKGKKPASLFYPPLRFLSAY
jgi:dolichyl-phosphate beta-glucosyltransferase